MTKQLHQTDVRMAILNQNYVPGDTEKLKLWQIYYHSVQNLVDFPPPSLKRPSDSIFKIQTRIIRVITSSGRYDSCRELFKKLQILPLQSQYEHVHNQEPYVQEEQSQPTKQNKQQKIKPHTTCAIITVHINRF
jgi:hypothetical protein